MQINRLTMAWRCGIMATEMEEYRWIDEINWKNLL